MKKYWIYIFWFFTSALLLYLSGGYYDSSTSILAQVEPQRYAISFQKPVRVKEIHVIPGQQVKKGDKLISVERQDLLLDVDRKEIDLNRLRSGWNIMKIESSNKKTLAQLAYTQELASVNADLERTQLIISSHEGMSQNLSALNLWGDSISSTDQTYLELRRDLLEKKRQNLTSQHNIRLKEIDQILALNVKSIVDEIAHLEQQIKLLIEEESELIQVANRDGTIGNVYTEKDELVQPYTTLISLYENDPTTIRALMHENQRVELKTGDNVIVESTNREYKINGVVKEVGSRIIEYPSRLRTFQEVTEYGRELFIDIPKESDFLNGEKVFVKWD